MSLGKKNNNKKTTLVENFDIQLFVQELGDKGQKHRKSWTGVIQSLEKLILSSQERLHLDYILKIEYPQIFVSSVCCEVVLP